MKKFAMMGIALATGSIVKSQQHNLLEVVDHSTKETKLHRLVREKDPEVVLKILYAHKKNHPKKIIDTIEDTTNLPRVLAQIIISYVPEVQTTDLNPKNAWKRTPLALISGRREISIQDNHDEKIDAIYAELMAILAGDNTQHQAYVENFERYLQRFK